MAVQAKGLLVGEAREMGWPEELVELYQESYRSMVRTAYVLLGSRQDAEEVVQEAVTAMARKWRTVRHPPAYLRRTVVNGAYGVIRRRKIAERHQPDPPPPGVPDELVELRDLLLALPWRQRAAIVLRYVEGRSDAEIARTLRCRRSTVRSLVARGLRAVRSEVTT